MPSWKRVIVSGSDAVLNSLNITTALTASGSAEITGSLKVIGNTAITGSLNMSGPISNVNFIDFNTAFSATQPTAGRLSWNNSDGTLDLGLKGNNVTLQLGQETLYEIRNETTSSIPKGTSLFANGVTPGSGRITAAPFVADGNTREVRYLGLASENISTGINGFVTHFGYIRGLDTRGDVPSSIAVGDENWSVGDILYAHPTVPGKLTNIRPKHEIIVAIIIIRHQSTGVIFVRPSSFGHLDDIHDVNINTGSLSSGDLLVYDSGSDYWINTKQLTGSYSLTGSLEATSFTGSLLGTASFATSALSASFATTASYVFGFGETTKLFQLTASTTWSFSHNLGEQYPQINVYDGANKIVIPSEIEAIDSNNMLIYFATPTSGVAAASIGGTATTASYATTFTIESVTLKTDENTDVDTGTEVISTVSTIFYDGAFFDYRIKNGPNLRVGTVTAVWSGSTAEYTDVSTNDIGNTSPVTMSVDVSSSFARLLATTSTDDWDIKTFVRMI